MPVKRDWERKDASPNSPDHYEMSHSNLVGDLLIGNGVGCQVTDHGSVCIDYVFCREADSEERIEGLELSED